MGCLVIARGIGYPIGRTTNPHRHHLAESPNPGLLADRLGIR
ncbi:hypothetical protein I545_2233 [Mycobacterium kansasii 662]|uniref:Uncharacterized protein n=2 Tax=Mycobacterium kansasii TaxID=1768 RepID=A0A1V3XQ02_MYCKA|nr:hypothetical protein I547_4094 [Mycobacterium kansasii 824]EUA20014.1 hypothetical protein I545_2233 [Mycobacterium kansasii 662]OOK78675.1 hypothetical protein BZL30_1990 [Mycobacterium kansasii]OOK80581.1 hypothetical protein BZL29_2022 [Mycobacterium kansasii]